MKSSAVRVRALDLLQVVLDLAGELRRRQAVDVDPLERVDEPDRP